MFRPGGPITSTRGLADRRGVLDTAHGPQVIEPARDAERRFGADVALEYLAVIADVADNPGRPILGQPDLLPEVAVRADQPLDLRLVRVQGAIDGPGADPQFLGIDHGEMRPFHDG